MGNLGARVSQPKYNVQAVSDKFISFTTSAKSLKVFKEVSFSGEVPAESAADLEYVHNLGYFAPFLVVYNSNSVEGQINKTMYEGFNYYQYRDKLTIGIFNSELNPVTYYFTIYIFLDPFDEYESINIGSGGVVGIKGDNYGIRISKKGKNVKECDDVDCVISSSFASNIIHKMGITPPATIVHNLGYVPMYFVYVHFAGNEFIESNQLYAFSSYANENEIVFDDISQDYNYYVIFKNTF